MCEKCHKAIDEERLDIIPETTLCSSCAKNKQEVPVTKRELNQNLINHGESFYDEVLIQLNDINDVDKRY